MIVDGAQDFADLWWQPVLKSLRDEELSGLYLYSDENQRLFARFDRPPVQLVPLVLDHDLRTTRQIHESFGSLAPSRMYSRGGDGAVVRFVGSTPEEALAKADDEGWLARLQLRGADGPPSPCQRAEVGGAPLVLGGSDLDRREAAFAELGTKVVHTLLGLVVVQYDFDADVSRDDGEGTLLEVVISWPGHRNYLLCDGSRVGRRCRPISHTLERTRWSGHRSNQVRCEQPPRTPDQGARAVISRDAGGRSPG